MAIFDFVHVTLYYVFCAYMFYLCFAFKYTDLDTSTFNYFSRSDEFKKAQAAMMLEQASEVDIIITTALIPGRKAPVLVNQDMLDVMKQGSVCVDLAAANGGNVAQPKANEIVTTSNGVKIV